MSLWTQFKQHCNDKYATQCHYLSCFQRMTTHASVVNGMFGYLAMLLALVTVISFIMSHIYVAGIFMLLTLADVYILYYCWRYFV